MSRVSDWLLDACAWLFNEGGEYVAGIFYFGFFWALPLYGLATLIF